ncbi:MAG TPA: VOC family protein [Lentisphaeria bacterium]|nr:MAG: glyoxalase [Lentisphaerae bacterium GWF2_49_21]HBC87879.1 VOC family protein [Lentisphaeria bacterium]
MIKQLAHICFHTRRTKEMVSFYTEKLGLKLKFTLDNEDRQPFGYYIACGTQTFIEIFDHAMAQKKWSDGKVQELVGGNQYKHFCLQVDNIEQLKADLEKKGVKVTDVKVGMDNSKQAWIGDPDGNAIELMEYTAKSLQVQK